MYRSLNITALRPSHPQEERIKAARIAQRSMNVKTKSLSEFFERLVAAMVRSLISKHETTSVFVSFNTERESRWQQFMLLVTGEPRHERVHNPHRLNSGKGARSHTKFAHPLSIGLSCITHK